MIWHKLESEEALIQLIDKSHQLPQIVFKHSKRCSLSALALSRVQPDHHSIDFHLLDIISYRDLSNNVASVFQVAHESPQILIIYKGVCTNHMSHQGITKEFVNDNVKQFIKIS